jgi:hypothetical protein
MSRRLNLKSTTANSPERHTDNQPQNGDDIDASKSGANEQLSDVGKYNKSAGALAQTALCLSGGGIRSAAFGLGIIQALARKDLLLGFDYLSTVSGGGYVGAWLSAWMSRAKTSALDELKKPISTTDSPIGYLRQYSRYLTPNAGLLSADALAVGSLYLRNLLLNWAILIPLFLLLLLAVKLVAVVGILQSTEAANFSLMIGICLIGGSLTYSLLCRPGFEVTESNRSRYFLFELWPLMVGSVLVSLGYAALTAKARPNLSAWYCIEIGLSVSVIAWLIPSAYSAIFALGSDALSTTRSNFKSQLRVGKCWPFIFAMIAYLASGASAGAVVAGILFFVEQVPGSNDWLPWLIISFGPLTIALAIFFAELLYIGLNSRIAWGDSEREWLARAGGTSMVWAIGVTALLSLVLVGSPFILDKVIPLAVSSIEQRKFAGVLSGALSLLCGVVSALLAKASSTGVRSNMKRGWLDIVMDVALAVTTALFITTSISLTSAWMDYSLLGDAIMPSKTNVALVQYLAIAIAAVFSLLCLSQWTININKFSLHNIYRNRLIRTFLGASHSDRNPNPFTNFDELDNLKLKDLWPNKATLAGEPPPMHVINMALNVVGTKQLAWQERKALSFTATSLRIGCGELNWSDDQKREHLGAYRSSENYADGMSLGTAIALSGAAASPNMGYHSSPWSSLVLTLFNVRLGGWYGNPNPVGHKTFKQEGPKSAVLALLNEAFGATTNERKYIYLSDGGHFENLAVYEMIRRRCRYILVSDAGHDPDCAFEDLGNLVRRVSMDFGVRIAFKKLDISKRALNAPEGKWFSVAKVTYPEDPDNPGYLIYLKPTYNGGGPISVVSYANLHPEFPQESTSNQWFGETQFEAYRALGEYLAEQLLDEMPAQNDLSALMKEFGRKHA